MKSKIVYIVVFVGMVVILTACDATDIIGSGEYPADNVFSTELVSSFSHSENTSKPNASDSTNIIPESIESSTDQYPIVDTGQDHCYSNSTSLACPVEGESFFGQDAQYQGNQPSYIDNGDGTITDLITGLMWQQNPDLDQKQTFTAALAGADTFNLAGYDDWRLPTIKELYSLIDFNGSAAQEVPYLDIDYFGFRFGMENLGEREIDAQYWSSTEYVGTTMNGNQTIFGVNFADGRIKGYPASNPRGGHMEQFVRYVRGNTQYGTNDFIENNDGTITDLSTSLIWQKDDSDVTLDWKESLNFCESLEFAGFDDWRLPNTKELHSIVDYTRSPQTTNSAAIDPIFVASEIESWYWTSTTHLDNGVRDAVYIAFGQGFGLPNGNLVDVHGAGAQRSDPKSGDPVNFSEGRGTEGQDDQVRIYNYARCVRGGISSEIFVGGEVDEHSELIAGPGTLEKQKNSDLGPPQEAINACDSLIIGTSCSFTAPQGDISGFCRIVKNNTMACVPEGGPPGANPAAKP